MLKINDYYLSSISLKSIAETLPSSSRIALKQLFGDKKKIFFLWPYLLIYLLRANVSQESSLFSSFRQGWDLIKKFPISYKDWDTMKNSIFDKFHVARKFGLNYRNSFSNFLLQENLRKIATLFREMSQHCKIIDCWIFKIMAKKKKVAKIVLFCWILKVLRQPFQIRAKFGNFLVKIFKIQQNKTNLKTINF